jgi:TatD DNase family protein
MKLIDTHCHLTFEPFLETIDDVLQRSLEVGVSQWITVGTDIEHSRAAVKVAGAHEGVWSTVGVHPHEARHWRDGDDRVLGELSEETGVVAIGEIGLDFHYDFSTPAQQEKVFAAQLQLAAERALPVVIHTREAFARTMAILRTYLSGIPRVVLHCFTGSAEEACEALSLGAYLSFTGAVTFKNAHEIRKAAQVVPLDRLMIETDCPYMSPEPVRKHRINEPAFLIHTAQFLAALKGVAWETFVQEVGATSSEFFCLTDSQRV